MFEITTQLILDCDREQLLGNYNHDLTLFRSLMETQPILNIDGYNLFVRHFANNIYHLNIVTPEELIHHFEGIYPNPQAAIDRGKTVIENLIFLAESKPRKAGLQRTIDV